MAYTPTTLATGDVITADKLNNIEQGIVNAGSGGGSSVIIDVVYADEDEAEIYGEGCYQQMVDAIAGGNVPVLRVSSEGVDPTVAAKYAYLSSASSGNYEFDCVSSFRVYKFIFNGTDRGTAQFKNIS